jgi:hypothetical protein
MYKNATKCNKTIGKWCKTKHGASKIIDTFETYQADKQRRPRAVHGWRRSLVVLDVEPAHERKSRTDLGWSPAAREEREWIRSALGSDFFLLMGTLITWRC